LDKLPRLDGWTWLIGGEGPSRDDMVRWEKTGIDFTDLVASVDVVLTKPGYGTFTEAGLAGTPLLYLERPDWPETAHLAAWLERYAPCRAASESQIFSPELEKLLMELGGGMHFQNAQPTGIDEVIGFLQTVLEGGVISCERS
jgi:hypothetical protein